MYTLYPKLPHKELVPVTVQSSSLHNHFNCEIPETHSPQATLPHSRAPLALSHTAIFQRPTRPKPHSYILETHSPQATPPHYRDSLAPIHTSTFQRPTRPKPHRHIPELHSPQATPPHSRGLKSFYYLICCPRV